MTPQEAINCIDDVLNSDYHYDESLGYQLTSDDFEWLEKSKKALEKQIPMQVNLTEVSKVKAVDVEIKEIYTYPVVRCPSCDKPITLYKERKFCEHCGQALDWSDNE